MEGKHERRIGGRIEVMIEYIGVLSEGVVLVWELSVAYRSQGFLWLRLTVRMYFASHAE